MAERKTAEEPESEREGEGNRLELPPHITGPRTFRADNRITLEAFPLSSPFPSFLRRNAAAGATEPSPTRETAIRRFDAASKHAENAMKKLRVPEATVSSSLRLVRG